MRKHILLFIFFIVLAFSNSCNKEKDDDIQPTVTPTSLEISLKDDLGNVISGASVQLYSSQTDWENRTNQIGETQISDAMGTVKFSELSSIKYYWLAEKDCKNNVNGAITTSSALTENVTNTIDIILTSTGTLKFVSTSDNPYRIYINGDRAFDMNGGETKYKYYMPTGSYSIRVLQLSGYLFTATDKTYMGTLSCGQTMTTSFPYDK